MNRYEMSFLIISNSILLPLFFTSVMFRCFALSATIVVIDFLLSFGYLL